MNCRTIWHRITHRAAHPLGHARRAWHVVRARYVATLVCTGVALGSGFGAAALIRHEAPEIAAPAVHAAEAPAPTREFDLPAAALVPASWAPASLGLVRDDDDHDRDDPRHRHHHKHHGPHPISTPEPGTLAILLVGLVAVAGVRRRA